MSRPLQRSLSSRPGLEAGRQRYKTVAAGGIRLGRLCVVFDVDYENLTLYVNLPSAQELQSLTETGFENDFHVRLQLLPSLPVSRVVRSLFAAETPVSSASLKHSQRHRATPNPTIEEEFAFELELLMPRLEEMRLYIAVISTAPVASDDTGFVGCVSFPLETIYRRGRDMPRWFWLFNQRAGLERCEPVQHVQIFDARDQGPPEIPDVVVAGRRRGLPNSHIVGTYGCRNETFGQRRVYKQKEHGLYMYFHAQRGSWVIADAVGHPAPYAFVDDFANAPGDVRGVWQVFNREREFHTFESKRRASQQAAHPAAADGGFELDLHVTCRSVGAAKKTPVRRSSAPSAPVGAYQSLFMQMQLNPELSHRPEPETEPILPRRPGPVALSMTSLQSPSRLPPLPAYMFPPMDVADEVFGDDLDDD